MLQLVNEGQKISQPVSVSVNLSRKKVEVFALDLVRLIRSARVYPSKHPSFFGVAERIVSEAPVDSTGSLTIGVTPAELVVSGKFVDGKAARLSSLLHARKVLRIFWSPRVSPEDVWTFARLLSTPSIEGEELRQRLHSEGVYSIDLEPLKIDNIHAAITDSASDLQNNPEMRRRQAWISLMDAKTPASQIGSALASEKFWAEAKTTWADLGFGDSEGFSNLLLDLGERFEEAISLLPEQQRETVLNHFAEIGRSLSVQDLVRIIAREGQGAKDLSQGMTSLVRKLDGERFVDVMAGLVAHGNLASQRLVEVYRCFNPSASASDLLSLVKARLSLGQDSGFAIKVWKTVEDLIVKGAETPFMNSEYSESLDHLVDPSASAGPGHTVPELLPKDSEAPNVYLDYMVLALSLESEEFWCKRLLHRIEARSEQPEILRCLEYVNLVDRFVPMLLESSPSLLRNLFIKGLAALSKSDGEREALARFTLAHERVLLDTVVNALSKEEKMSRRHFLVNLLASFSSAATPAFVSKARNGPWYIVRNLAIVLGRQGFPQAIPVLRDLSNHVHPKVRREAVKALKNILNSNQNSLPETSTDGTGRNRSALSRPLSYALDLGEETR